MADDRDEQIKAKLSELERAIRVLFTARDEYMVRLEAMRVLCEQKDVFSEETFQQAVATLTERGREEEARVRAHLEPGRAESLAELLRKYEGPQQ
jgi:hypothetical protein